MISIITKEINDLPILEICDSEKLGEELPLVFFYHGWTGCKERVLTQGYEIAKKGFRVILPDALYHGDRQEGDVKGHVLEFWKIVLNSVKEFPTLVDYYRENVGIKDGFVGVSGLSMGGITTNALMTTHPWINAGVCLMGSPKPVKFAKKLVADAATQVKGMPDTEVDKQISALEPFDLSLNLEKLASRPLHFWHGTADKMVPYQDTVDFYRENIGKSYTENVTLTTTENAGHKVSQETTLEMANKFNQYYQKFVGKR